LARSSKVRRIAINTGGGDAPGLNAVVHAAVLSALRRGWEVVGILRGYAGLLDTKQIMPLGREEVRGIAHLGGTILGTASHGNPFALAEPDGENAAVDRSAEIVENFHRLGLDALIAIGGDGSMKIAHALDRMGIPIVGVPKTIDNDLDGTVVTFGFDTAMTVATEAVDRLHSTAEAHERVFTVEVMGRYAGWIALYAGIAGGADAILMPEIPFDLDNVCAKIAAREAAGRHFSLVVVAEGALPRGGAVVSRPADQPGGQVRLGGIGELVADELHRRTGKETRNVVLGHLQRGGRPTPHDRLLAQRFGSAAVRVIAAGRHAVMVALDPPTVRTVPLEVATRRMKTVPLDSDTVRTAREMGICLGDAWEPTESPG
jgi:ATP-dependent phosphofructokinase / diphosphate-dependent phosphofructokinase